MKDIYPIFDGALIVISIYFAAAVFYAITCYAIDRDIPDNTNPAKEIRK